MKLNDYLKDKNPAEFARKIGVDYSTLWRWRTGKAIPNNDMILKIKKITNDSVRGADWYDL